MTRGASSGVPCRPLVSCRHGSHSTRRAPASPFARSAWAVLGALAAWLGAAGVAHATEGESDVAVIGGVTFLDARSKGVHLGAGTSIVARHGLSDAFDLAAELSLSLQPTLGTNLYGAALGSHYVVDVGRFRPHLGLLLGVTDVSTTACDPRPSNLPDVTTQRPPIFACRESILPTGVVPFGVDWAPDAPIRIGFASRFAMMAYRDGIPDILLSTLVGGSFTWVFDADEASR